MWSKNYLILMLCFLMNNSVSAQLKLADKGKSDYKIVISSKANEVEKKSATVLKNYFFEITNVPIPIITDDALPSASEICIGKTNRKLLSEKLSEDGFLIKTVNKRLFIYGNADKSVLYGVYHFLDQYLGCRKFTSTISYIPKQQTIIIPQLHDVQNPVFSFRQVYYPGQYDEEFQDWHKLKLLDNEWGLWGHTFDKLLSPVVYFKDHPEYFALVNGERKPTQLCLSNLDVYAIVVENLANYIKEDPEKKIWSVSQNDGLGYCECDACKAIDTKYGGPQGSVINFVNKVAANFPDQTISTLAYLYSKHPPVHIKPAKNVSILLSSIAINRALPAETDPRSAAFRNDVNGWSVISHKLMIWDYVVQFTNYLSPFPNLETIPVNLAYFKEMKMTGVFSQGTGDTFGEFSFLKAYLLARLTWNPNTDFTKDLAEFMQAYYGNAAPFIRKYQDELQLQKSGRFLDIYGDPISEWNTWLSPQLIEIYSDIFDQAEVAVQDSPEQLTRVRKERLALEFVVLQQARFYGLEKHGIFIQDKDEWKPRLGFEDKINRFIALARETGVKTLTEDGLTIDDYASEWAGILKNGPLLHLALGKKMTALIPYSDEYLAKKNYTLTDGIGGYNNFQYNYLGWYGTDMEIVIDLEEAKDIKFLSIGFLEDQRHWAFLPLKIEVETSVDNDIYFKAGSLALANPEENYAKETHRLRIDLKSDLKVRYLKVKAKNLQKLPEWRDFPNRKSWVFCDEIAVY